MHLLLHQHAKTREYLHEGFQRWKESNRKYCIGNMTKKNQKMIVSQKNDATVKSAIKTEKQNSNIFQKNKKYCHMDHRFGKFVSESNLDKKYIPVKTK
jgi:hypothetical protein